MNTGANLLLTAIGPRPVASAGVTLCCASTGGAAVTASSPALPGETVIIYATGTGLPVLTPAVQPYTLTGNVYKGTADNTPIESVSALVDSTTATTLAAFLFRISGGLSGESAIEYLPGDRPARGDDHRAGCLRE